MRRSSVAYGFGPLERPRLHSHAERGNEKIQLEFDDLRAEVEQARADAEQERAAKEQAHVIAEQALAAQEQERAAKEDALAENERLKRLLADNSKPSGTGTP